MKSIFEQMGDTYHWEGDYLIPDITLGEDARRDIGIYGRKHMRFLEECHPVLYSSMLLSGQLWRNLEEINTACYERLEFLIPAMACQEGVTEAMKASDPLEWVGRMNNIRNRAEEIILHDLVYTLY